MSTDSLCFYDEVSMLQLIFMDRGTDKNIHELLPKTVILKKQLIQNISPSNSIIKRGSKIEEEF